MDNGQGIHDCQLTTLWHLTHDLLQKFLNKNKKKTKQMFD